MIVRRIRGGEIVKGIVIVLFNLATYHQGVCVSGVIAPRILNLCIIDNSLFRKDIYRLVLTSGNLPAAARIRPLP